jgi:Uma2 family endonuclease
MSTVSLPTSLLSFEEFIALKPDGSTCELHEGIPYGRQPVGQHEEIVAFLTLSIAMEVGRLALPYLLPKQALIKTSLRTKNLAFGLESAYCPDISVIKRNALAEEPLWNSASTLIQGSSFALVIEVADTNDMDHRYKLADYESLGISECWIINYLPLDDVSLFDGSRVPNVSVYRVSNGKFVLRCFQGNELIISDVFPEMKITVDQVLNASYQERING